MIVSIKGKLTADILTGNKCPKGFPGEIFQRAKRKLQMIVAAAELSDLNSAPGNRLKALAGDRRGQHSIRINAVAGLFPMDCSRRGRR